MCVYLDLDSRMLLVMLKKSNSSFLRGFCMGLCVSLVFILHEQWRFVVTELYRPPTQRLRESVSYDGLKFPHGEVVQNEAHGSVKDEAKVVKELFRDNRGGKSIKNVSLLYTTRTTVEKDDHNDNVGEHKFEDASHHHDDDSVAKSLYDKVRVACWILTSPTNLMKKAIHVRNTWAKRCNIVYFMSSERNDTFPAVALNVTEGREHLTAKTMQAFKYMYDHHLNDADWFLKADDDTYVILENLRYFLSNEDPNSPVYFGQRFKPYIKQGYPSGGGGYVLSRESLRRYGADGYSNPNICARDKGAEDMQMGKCLQNLGVSLKSSVDALRRSRFHCFPPESFIYGNFPKWFHQYDLEGIGGGIENVSDYAISFHYVSPKLMYALEYYTYHLQAYGISHKLQSLNRI